MFNPPRNPSHPTWLFGDTPVKVSDSYRYLGIIFHARTGITTAPTHLHAAGERALHALHQRCSDLRLDTPSIMCRLFDSLIAPVLSYGCEVWSYSSNASSLSAAEVLHRRFLKRIAGMHPTTATPAVYGEFGRTPLSIHWHCLAANFISRLASLPDGRPAKHALLAALDLEQGGFSTGLGTLRRHLAATGISATSADELAALKPANVKQAAQQHWETLWQQQTQTPEQPQQQQQPPPTPADSSQAQQTPANAAAARRQRQPPAPLWQQQIHTAATKPPTDTSHSKQLANYLSLQPTFSFSSQAYLADPSIPLKHRTCISRIRCGNHWLAEHTSRYQKTAERLRIHRTPCTRCLVSTWIEANPMLLCDSCDAGWHCLCLHPPLTAPPPDEHWYCPTCVSHDRCQPTALEAANARLEKAAHCPHCNCTLENLPHFLFACPFYQHLRSQFPDIFHSELDTPHAWLAQPNTPRVAEYLFMCYNKHRKTLR